MTSRLSCWHTGRLSWKRDRRRTGKSAAPPVQLGFWRTVCIVFECVSVCSSDGSHGLQGFPDALTQKPNQIYPKMFALTMRRGVTLSTLYTMRRWHSHTRTLTHTAGFIYKLCFLLGTQQVQCLSLNCLEL